VIVQPLKFFSKFPTDASKLLNFIILIFFQTVNVGPSKMKTILANQLWKVFIPYFIY